MRDHEIIFYYTGLIVLGIAFLMAIPIATALIFKEWNPLCDFTISMSVSTLIGLAMIFGADGPTKTNLTCSGNMALLWPRFPGSC